MDKYDDLDVDNFLTYLDYMIRYEDIDLEDEFFDDPPDDDLMPPADLVKVFKSVSSNYADLNLEIWMIISPRSATTHRALF